MQPTPANHGRGSDLFADMVENVANSRPAEAHKPPSGREDAQPRPDGRARPDSAPRGQSAGMPEASLSDSGSQGTEAIDDETPANAVAASDKSQAETATDPNASDIDEEADGTVTAGETFRHGSDATNKLVPAVSSVADGTSADPQQVADGQVETLKDAAVVPDAAPLQTQGEAAPMLVAVATDRTAASREGSSTGAVSTQPVKEASVLNTNSPPSDGEAASKGAVPQALPRGATPTAEQQLQPPANSPSGQAATVAEGTPVAPKQGEAEAQFKGPADTNSIKFQDSKAQPADVSKTPTPAIEAASQRGQTIVVPEPVRALAANFSTTGLQAANTSDRSPVPLTPGTIAVEIVSRFRDGMRRFDIRLDPPELGRIDVRLEVDRAGNVSTKLTLDRPETLDLMQRDARGLERALQQAGLKTDGGGLEFSLRSHADGAATQDHSSRGARGEFAHLQEDGDRTESVIEGYRSAAFARGGVDIRI